jgi:chromosome segregation ATPase
MSTEVREAQAELEELRARVEALEAELIEAEAWASETVARAREKTYWLDRWQIDLNELMRRRSADRIRAVARAVRGIRRALLRLKSEYPT